MVFSMEVLQWHVFMVFLGLAAAWPDHHIKISPGGNDNTTCLTNYSLPCQTLDFVLSNSLNSSTLLEITEGRHSLDNIYNIKEKQDISIVGEPGKQVVIACNASLSNGTGLSWLQSKNITFRFLDFDGCGHLIHTSPLQDRNDTIYKFFTGLSFVYCLNLDFYNCTFRNNVGLAITAYDTGGKVNFVGSKFIRNGAANASDIGNGSEIHRSGGGVMIHLTKFGYFSPFNDTIHQRYSSNNHFYFRETIFRENSYHITSTTSTDVPAPFGWGAGLTIILCGTAKKNNFSIDSSHFERNEAIAGGGLTIIVRGTAKNNNFSIDSSHFERNEAIFGGGMFAEFYDLAGGNTISLSDNYFIMNNATFAGGAIRTGNAINERNNTVTVDENKIEILRNHFYTNKANLGGGWSHYGFTYYQQTNDDYRTIVIKECIFEGNIATVGSAIFLSLNNGNNWLAIGPQLPYIVHLVDCMFNSNVADDNQDNVTATMMIGMGCVYTTVPLVLKGNNSFFKNSYTALLLDNAPLKVINETLFEKNTGYVGGALAFYGQTRLVMTKNSRLLFRNNKAKQKGGAIYIRTPGPDIVPFNTTKLRRHQCILQYEDEDFKMIDIEHINKWQTKLEFLNNEAPELHGNSLYANTLQSCYRQGETSTNNKAFEWENIIDFHGKSTEDEISTNPVSINFTTHDWLDLAPYEMFDASVLLRDEKHNTVSGIVKIEVTPTSDGYPKLEPESSLFLVQASNSTKSIVPGLRIKGSQNQKYTLKISTFDGQVVEVFKTMKLGQCREGFEQTDHSYKCTCMKDTDEYHEGVHNCSENGRSVNLKMGYWGGLVPNGTDRKVFVTYPCPEHYCYFDAGKSFFTYNINTICSSNRTSHLCGQCKKNYTLTLGNETCIPNAKCDKNGYRIIWLLPVFFIVVPIVVFLLLRLDFDIFTPYLGSWLYFYQILPYVVQQIERFDVGMQFILSLAAFQINGANLYCFMRGLDNIYKLFFNYLFPLYVLFVVIAIAKITRWCGWRCFGRSNVFNAISTIVVFIYTDLTLISFNVVRWVSLGPNLKVLFVQGSVSSKLDNYSIQYYILLSLAIVVIFFFVIALPFILIVRPFLPERVKRVRFLANFTTLFNIFQGCYRDKWICFSAYYFVLRIVILFLDSIVLTEPGPLKRWWIEMILGLSLIILVYVKPYKTDDDSKVKWLNFVDTFILTLLCLMSRMSSTRNSEASQKTVKQMTHAITVLSWFPMIYLLILIVIAIRKCNAAFRRARGYQEIEDVSSGGTQDNSKGTDETSLTKSNNTYT